MKSYLSCKLNGTVVVPREEFVQGVYMDLVVFDRIFTRKWEGCLQALGSGCSRYPTIHLF